MRSRFLHLGAVTGSVIASTFTGFRGALIVHAAKQPEKPLTLYEFEACPNSRAVREALSALHLDAEIRPCPKGGTRFRPEAERIGGRAGVPLLIDANTNTTLYDSRSINEYLFGEYAGTHAPSFYRPNELTRAFGSLASATRILRGRYARPSRAPAEPLHLTSFESSPFSRLVRERLSELELPYTLHNLGKEHWTEAGPAVRRITPNPYVPKSGGKRESFFHAHGRVQVPFLHDPNTGVAMFESARIVAYLESTYAVGA